MNHFFFFLQWCSHLVIDEISVHKLLLDNQELNNYIRYHNFIIFPSINNSFLAHKKHVPTFYFSSMWLSIGLSNNNVAWACNRGATNEKSMIRFDDLIWSPKLWQYRVKTRSCSLTNFSVVSLELSPSQKKSKLNLGSFCYKLYITQLALMLAHLQILRISQTTFLQFSD